MKAKELMSLTVILLLGLFLVTGMLTIFIGPIVMGYGLLAIFLIYYFTMQAHDILIAKEKKQYDEQLTKERLGEGKCPDCNQSMRIPFSEIYKCTNTACPHPYQYAPGIYGLFKVKTLNPNKPIPYDERRN